jgi:hypothetical protein
VALAGSPFIGSQFLEAFVEFLLRVIIPSSRDIAIMTGEMVIKYLGDDLVIVQKESVLWG